MGDQILRKCEKILNRKEFLTIYQQGKRSYSRNFTIIVLKNALGYRRIGITVSKKVGNAVRRNRIKRLIREFFRLHKENLAESHDIVIIGMKKIPFLNYRNVCDEFTSLASAKARE